MRSIGEYFHITLTRASWLVFRLLPVDPRKVVVCSYFGRGYGDNGKYIVQKLLEKDEKLQIIWLVKSPEEAKSLPAGVTACPYNTVEAARHLMTARVWVDNSRKNFIICKRKNQTYIQTWHGFALKRIEKDVADKLPKRYVSMSKRDSQNIDYIISCSKFMSGIYRSSFWYDGEILEYGAPRNDILIHQDSGIRKKVFEHLGIDEGKKVVLYAPTFRVDKRMNVYNLDCMRLIRNCEKRFGGDFVVVTRLHPNIAEQSDVMQFSDRVINGSFYPDMQELMLASDIIVTDYSSVMFDFSLSRKPCFQYAVDIADYKNDRNFYIALDQLPFSLATDNDEMERIVLEFDEEAYQDKLQRFFDEAGMVLTGNASEKTAELIMDLIRKKGK